MIGKTLISAVALALSLAAAQSAMAALNNNGTQINGTLNGTINGSYNASINGMNSGLSSDGASPSARIIAVELPAKE